MVTPAVEELFPYARRVRTVGGHELAYVDEGSGPPVLMVHGNPTWGFAYRELIAGLRGDHRVIVPDHIGMGRSSRPDPTAYRYTLQQRIDDLGALVDELLPTGPVDLVLHDWGGPIGLGWATQHPDRVARVLLMNTVAFPLGTDQGLPRLLRFARSPVGLPLIPLGAFNLGTLLLGARRRLPAAVARGYLAPYRSRGDREAVLRFVRDIPVGPTDPAWVPLRRTAAHLDRFRDHEVVICWGMRDPVFTPAFLAEWRRRLPGARIVELPDAGHLVMEDAPGRVLAAARDLFASPPAGWPPSAPGRSGAGP